MERDPPARIDRRGTEATDSTRDGHALDDAISDRVKLKLLLPMAGIVSSVVIAVCGFFVLSMKESVADIKVGMEKNSTKLEVISEKLTEVQIDIARIRADGRGWWGGVRRGRMHVPFFRFLDIKDKGEHAIV